MIDTEADLQPAWLARAWAEVGQREGPSTSDNPRVLQYYRDAGHPGVTHDEVAWCAAFVGACLERVGIASTRSLMARSYLSFGEPLARGRVGAIAVLSRGADPALGHVGFWVGETESSVLLLGGNQGDAVAVSAYAKEKLLGLRWPTGSGSRAEGEPEPDDSIFRAALAHVLEMEGGWSDDPHDPGGPTNQGITLETFAAWRGQRVTVHTRAALGDALKVIPAETVRTIYEMRYWRPSRSALLPSPLALMHFAQ